jgi:hypothetical protein
LFVPPAPTERVMVPMLRSYGRSFADTGGQGKTLRQVYTVTVMPPRCWDFGTSLLIGFSLLVESAHSVAAQSIDEQKACSRDWSKCADNRQLVQNYWQWPMIVTECQAAAERFIAPKGTAVAPAAPVETFTNYAVGNDYPNTGVAIVATPQFRYRDVSGGTQFASLECSYDLAKRSVIGIKED